MSHVMIRVSVGTRQRLKVLAAEWGVGLSAAADRVLGGGVSVDSPALPVVVYQVVTPEPPALPDSLTGKAWSGPFSKAAQLGKKS